MLENGHYGSIATSTVSLPHALIGQVSSYNLKSVVGNRKK